MIYQLLVVIGIIALIRCFQWSWRASAKLPSSTLRIFLRSGMIALPATPTILAGHGLLILPACVLWFWGLNFTDLLMYSLLPILVVWLLLFAGRWVWMRSEGNDRNP